jgi:hypothetical protein
MFTIDASIAEKHPRNKRRVNTVIATPRLGIVMQDFLGYLADGGLPGCKLTFVEPYEQIGRFALIRPTVNLQCVINLLDNRFVPARVAQFDKLGCYLPT